MPTRRGDAHADRVTIRTLGPLRLAGRQASLTVPGRLRVLPEFASRRHLPSRLARLRELDGRASVQVRGPGTEFDSLREYVIGDDVRSIDWRATARRVRRRGAHVAARARPPGADRARHRPHVRRARAGRPPDRRVDRGGAAARRARHQGRRPRGAARLRPPGARPGGQRDRPRRDGRRSRTRSPSLEPELVETDWPGVVAQVRQRLSQRALVVLLTALDPSAVEQGLLGRGRPAHRAAPGGARLGRPTRRSTRCARPARGAAAVFDAAAAERVGLERAAVAVRLRQRGAEVVDALPDDLAPRLADTYIALKAAGRL